MSAKESTCNRHYRLGFRGRSKTPFPMVERHTRPSYLPEGRTLKIRSFTQWAAGIEAMATGRSMVVGWGGGGLGPHKNTPTHTHTQRENQGNTNKASQKAFREKS